MDEDQESTQEEQVEEKEVLPEGWQKHEGKYVWVQFKYEYVLCNIRLEGRNFYK